MKKNSYIMIIMLMISLLLGLKNVNAEATNNFSINGVIYSDIEDAVKNLNSGETINVLKDLDLTDKSGVVLTFPDNSTLNLNGHTITVKNMGIIYQGNNLTIENGHFKTTGSYALFVGDEIESNGILVKNITTIGGINVYDALNVVLRDVTSVGQNYYSVWADEHAQITIESGNYSTKGNYVIGISTEESSKITINGGVFTTTNDNLVLGGKYQAPVINGGIFDTDPTPYINERAKVTINKDGNYEVGFEKNIDLKPVDTSKEVEQPELGITNTSKIDEIILESLNNSSIDVSDKNIKIDVVTESIEIEKAEEEIIKKQVTQLNSNLILENYFDININIIDTDENKTISKLTELEQEIEFTIMLPKNLQKNNSNRKYYVIRNHNDKVDILDTKISEDGKYLTFKSDKFSTYALAYEEEIKNPNTRDNIYSSIIIGFISLIGLGIVISIIRRKFKKETV